MMRIGYLPVNAAWVVLFGEAPLRLDGEPMFFSSRHEAVIAAERHGFEVTASGMLRSV